MTADGFGDYLSGSVHQVDEKGGWLNLCKITSEDSKHSIAQLYAYITAAMGFMVLEHEYKLMGMAPYANENRCRDLANGFKLLFPLQDGKWMYQGGHIGEEIDRLIKYRRFDEICGALQLFFEELIVEWIRYWINKTGIGNLCLSGGAFMNVKANKVIMEIDEVESLFIFPSCGDETNAIGAAYSSFYDKTHERPEPLGDFYLGRCFKHEDVSLILSETNHDVLTPDNIALEVAERLAAGEIVATFWGREEFGARALGNRSILADPRNPKVISVLNDMIKSRDFWMPFACAILDEDKDKYICDTGKIDPAFMIMCFDSSNGGEEIYSGTHPKDKTVRPQIVRHSSNPLFYQTIKKFKELTGVGALLNTSFNLHGYPVVGRPEDAIHVLENSGLDNLAFENYFVRKASHN